MMEPLARPKPWISRESLQEPVELEEGADVANGSLRLDSRVVDAHPDINIVFIQHLLNATLDREPVVARSRELKLDNLDGAPAPCMQIPSVRTPVRMQETFAERFKTHRLFHPASTVPHRMCPVGPADDDCRQTREELPSGDAAANRN